MKKTFFPATMVLATRLKALPKKPKFVLILLVCFLFSHANAQNCSYKTNEVDKFTKKFTKITKPKIIIGGLYTIGKISVKRIDTTYSFIFNYFNQGSKPVNAHSVNKSAQIIFLFENEETITLLSEDVIVGTINVVYGIPIMYHTTLDNITYKLTKSQIELFLYSKIKSIRFYSSANNGQEDFVDYEIKNSNRDDIQSLVKCVL